MEFLRSFEPRPPHPTNPEIDFQCAVADIKDLARVLRREVNDLITIREEKLQKMGIDFRLFGLGLDHEVLGSDYERYHSQRYHTADLQVVITHQENPSTPDLIQVTRFKNIGNRRVTEGLIDILGDQEVLVDIPSNRHRLSELDCVRVPIAHNRFEGKMKNWDSWTPFSLALSSDQTLDYYTQRLRDIARGALRVFSQKQPTLALDK
ncbi:MAG: hypothetical protein HYW45_03735 [Candidatus Daviesbacteria bacterium]|nr:MAG: hypothetical protein HYW45_03735 [Candidatus Daviesbacteria bacterium]